MTALLLLALTPSASAGQPYVGSLVGFVDYVDDTDLAVDLGVDEGDLAVGGVLWDITAVDTDPDPQVGIYPHTQAPYGISIDVAGRSFHVDPSGVDTTVTVIDDQEVVIPTVQNDPVLGPIIVYESVFMDLLQVDSLGNAPQGDGLVVTSIGLDMTADTDTFSDDQIPVTAPDAAPRFWIRGTGPGVGGGSVPWTLSIDIASVNDASLGTLTLSQPQPRRAGEVNQWTIDGAAPYGQTFVVAGRPGSANVPGCPGLQIGIRPDLILGSTSGNVAGDASFSYPIPQAAQGLTRTFHAVELSTCRASAPVVTAFQ